MFIRRRVRPKFWCFVIALMLVVFGASFAFARQNLRAGDAKLAEVTAERNALIEKVQSLQTTLDFTETDEYVIRTARNEAAHAAVAADGAQAALLFNEAIEALEEGYAGTAFKENELAQYYREAEDYLNRCSEGKPLKARQSSPQNTQQGKAAARSKPRSAQQTRSTKNTAARSRSTGTKQSRSTASRSKKQQTGGESRVALGIILAALVLGLIARAISMGLV